MRLKGRDVQMCRSLVDEFYTEDSRDFLAAAAQAAGGQVQVLRPPRTIWNQVGMGAASGITLPFPGGWLTIVPETDVAEDTIFGHEAAHIVFGDVPHWTKARSQTRRLILERFFDGDLDLVQFLQAARSGEVESIWRHESGPQEQRAELVGTLFESRRRRPDRYHRDRVDHFFTVRADR